MGYSTSTIGDSSRSTHSKTGSSLCNVCRRIVSRDVPLPLREAAVPSHGIAGALVEPSFGTRRKISSRCCSLCPSVLSLADILGGPNAHADEPLELRAFRFSSSWPIFANAFAQHQIAQGNLPDACLFVCRKDAPPTNYDVRRALESRIAIGGLAVLAKSTNSEGGLPQLQPLRPQSFSIDKARSWIQTCLAEHGMLCGRDAPSPRRPVKGMKVIDCETLEIKRTTADTRWVALSYVWRLAVDNTPSSDIIGEQARAKAGTDPKLPAIIPSLIVDAIRVVRDLGYNSLWVDRYCINQDDEAEVKEQIAQMDRIYRGAELTIIAAGDNNGLEGVGSHVKRPILRATSFGPTVRLYETDRNPITEIRQSPWFSRGWTFQEAILSRRRLFFTPSQTLFECATTTCCEMNDLGGSMLQPAAHFTSFSLEALVYPEIPRLTQLLGSAAKTNLPPDLQGTLTPLDEYLEEAMALLKLYRSKSLSVESDTLDAFAGVLKVFEETPYNIGHLQGLPYPRRHSTESIMLLQQKSLALGLTWNGQGSRRVDFPSWSWAGWEAHQSTGLRPVGKQLGRFNGNFNSFIQVHHVHCKCGQVRVPLHRIAGHADAADHTPRVLELVGFSIPPDLLALKTHGDGTTYLEATGPQGLVYNMENRFRTTLCAEELLSGLADGTLLAFVLGEEETTNTRSLYVLVVGVKDRVGARIIGERRDLMLLTRMTDFTKDDPFLFNETHGLQAAEVFLD